MSVRHFSVDTSAGTVEAFANEWYGGENEIVAVEVFDSPDAKAHREYGLIGPWIVGSPDEVQAELDRIGSEDYATQYGFGPPVAD